MQIETEDNGRNGRFFIRRDGETVAEMDYHWHNDQTFVIDHTEVDESLKGQGVGNALVQRAVEWAREKGYKIHPVCPFAAAIMKRNDAYADVLSTHK